jgi:hypothetical protein
MQEPQYTVFFHLKILKHDTGAFDSSLKDEDYLLTHINSVQ